MKFETMQCPECKERAIGILEQVQCRANIIENKQGEVEYEGETDVWWEEQRPVIKGGNYFLLCENGHDWPSRCLDDPQGELCEAYSQHLMNEIKAARKEA